MDPDHTKQPSRYPSSNQRRHHRPVTTANNAEGFVTIVSKSPPSRRELSAKGSNVVINNLLESSKGSLDERKSDDLVTTSNFMNSSSGGSTSHSHIHTDGSNKGRLERPRQREVGKVKPIRIIPPQNLNEEEGKEKVLAILKSSSAWEGSVDNQRDGDHEDDGFEVQQEEFKESMETPEKMFISASEMGHKKYYLDRATAEEGKDQKPKVLLLQEGEISKEDELGSNKGESERGDESMKKGKGKQEEDLVGSQSTMSISSESLILKPSSMNLFSMSSSSSSERVKVIVRCRPMSKKELGQGHECVVTVNRESGEIEVKRPQSTTSTHSLYNNSGNIPDVKLFSFDSVYDQRIPQKQLYDDAFRPLVDSVLEGYNGTIFAYGKSIYSSNQLMTNTIIEFII
ncbi:Kinesin-like protein KIF3B [Orchesella cincta]|uniref:Kinesin-like protein KIF3B n=1 Tax=Orchesella cincta TaxID=48709 RepID=A0A1D2MI30_ORCCI|nr:Kinesin-like protein KIF3B [Orchesella cincta]